MDRSASHRLFTDTCRSHRCGNIAEPVGDASGPIGETADRRDGRSVGSISQPCLTDRSVEIHRSIASAPPIPLRIRTDRSVLYSNDRSVPRRSAAVSPIGTSPLTQAPHPHISTLILRRLQARAKCAKMQADVTRTQPQSIGTCTASSFSMANFIFDGAYQMVVNGMQAQKVTDRLEKLSGRRPSRSVGQALTDQ